MQELYISPEAVQSPRLGRRERKAARLATALEARVMNNDPLAHVRLVVRDGWTTQTESRIQDEIVTDLAERSKSEHFRDSFDFRYETGDMKTLDGGSLKKIYQSGYDAAVRDGIPYGIARAQKLQDQLPHILRWAESGNQLPLAFFSLCPDAEELDIETQKKLAFKPERQMSSNWLFEKKADGTIRMHTFSFDFHTKERHAVLLGTLGLPHEMLSTLEEVATPHIIGATNGDDAVERIRQSFEMDGSYYGRRTGKTLSANERVRYAPESIAIYKDTVGALAEALTVGRVTKDLRRITKQLSAGFGGFQAPVGVLNKRLYTSLSIHDAEELIDYLRGQALPHYIYSRHAGSTIATSGAEAVVSNQTYEGSCPTSDRNTSGDKLSDSRRLEFYLFRRRPIREKEFTSQYCPCCLPKPLPKTRVKAWMGEGFIGCDDCGHIVDVCGGVYQFGTPKRRKKIVEKQQTKGLGKKIPR